MLCLLEKTCNATSGPDWLGQSRDDQFNIILTIKNILKGDKVNKLYFLDYGGTQKFTDIIELTSDHQIIEMCISGIAEQASYKKFVVKILQFEEATERIKQIVKKCLEITDQWQEYQNMTNPNDKRTCQASDFVVQDQQDSKQGAKELSPSSG